jgi:hypothetical protein
LVGATATGHFEVVDFLLWEGKLGREDVMMKGEHGDWKTPFLEACIKGYLDILEAMAEVCELTIDDVGPATSYEPFRIACEYGQVDVVKWMVHTFQLTIEAARAIEYYAVRMSVKNSHRDVMVYLLEDWDGEGGGFLEDDADALAKCLGKK